MIGNSKDELKRILVHVCCAPCATGSVERLIQEGYRVILFYSNSNIFPENEYKKRLQHVLKFAEILNLDVIEDSYDHSSWLMVIKGLENEPERGKRCMKCFDFNLKRAATTARRLKIPWFTTTLTLSPRKVSEQIFTVGNNYPGYISFDFKKRGGSTRSSILSREYDLYRQHYCGCEFSLEESRKKRI